MGTAMDQKTKNSKLMGCFWVWGTSRADPLPWLWCLCWFVAEQKSSHSGNEKRPLGFLSLIHQMRKQLDHNPFHSQEATHSRGCACQPGLGSGTSTAAPPAGGRRGQGARVRKAENRGAGSARKSIFIVIKKGITVLRSSCLWWSKIKRKRRAREMIAQ